MNFELGTSYKLAPAGVIKNNINGKELNLKYSTDYIYSDKMETIIIMNGVHKAIQVEDTVFDNLTPNGMKSKEWEEDLDIRRDDKGEIIGGISVNEIPF